MTKLLNLKHNVHENCEKVSRVQADIDRKIYDYFFHHVIGYSFGSRQALITFFFQCLYEEFQRRNIPMHWDEDNQELILDIINNLNFRETKTKKTKKV